MLPGGFPHSETGFNVIDVHLNDLQTDTMGQIRRIFADLLGRKLTEENEVSMSKWLKENKREKHGRHSFDTKDFGINVDGNELFKKYSKQFQTKDAAAWNAASKNTSEILEVGAKGIAAEEL